MHNSMTITLLRYACNYSAGWYAVHWGIDLSSILLLYISKPHLVQAGISKPHLVQAGTGTGVANQACAWTQKCKIGGCCYFKSLCPVVISNSNPL